MGSPAETLPERRARTTAIGKESRVKRFTGIYIILDKIMINQAAKRKNLVLYIRFYNYYLNPIHCVKIIKSPSAFSILSKERCP
jgi:hypothetical protein